MIDFTTGTLANRALGAQALDLIRREADGTRGAIVLNFGSNIATMSWLDAVLSDLLDAAESRTAIVLCSTEDMREHIEALLKKRHLAVYVAADLEEFRAGNWVAVGHISEAQHACIEVLRRLGDALVADVARALDLSVEATQLRLTELLALHLAERRKEGRAYVYGMPQLALDEPALV